MREEHPTGWSGEAVDRQPALLRDLRLAWSSPRAAARARRALAAVPQPERAILAELLAEADAHRRRRMRAPLAWLGYLAIAASLAPALILVGAPHLLQPGPERVTQKLEDELARPAVFLPEPPPPPDEEPPPVLDPEKISGPVRPSAPGGGEADGLPVPAIDRGPAVIGARVDAAAARPSWLASYQGGGGGDGGEGDGEGGGGGIPEGMVYIAPGAFTMGSPPGVGEPHERPSHGVVLAPYAIDRDEVAVGAFQRWCASAGERCAWRATDAASMMADHPVTGVTWHEARAFCRAYGKDLPTEAQWEKAARWDPAGGNGRAYPWGDTAPSCGLSNFADCGVLRTVPVGSLGGASATGVRDLSGNAREWVLDWMGSYRPGRQTDPRGPAGGEQRVLRGGSYGGYAEDVRATDRDAAPPDTRKVYNGFRCAVAVEEEPTSADAGDDDDSAADVAG